MDSDIAVRVTCPDDDSGDAEPTEVVLRIDDSELALWFFMPGPESELGLKRSFRPFRGPRILQVALTLFFAPTILFGKRDTKWLLDGAIPRLRITPFVPAEFWVDLHFGSAADQALVAERLERVWDRPKRDSRPFHPLRFVADWWRLLGVVMFVSVMISFAWSGSRLWVSWLAFGGFALYVATIMVVEVCRSRAASPPKRPCPNADADTTAS